MKLSDYKNWKSATPSSSSPQQQAEDRDLAKILTIKAPAVAARDGIGKVEETRSITERLRAMSTLSLPAMKKPSKSQVHTPRDTMCYLVGLTACLLGIAADIYYFATHQMLLYDDASSHLRIARAVFDSMTPGAAQLGSVWLPLPQVLFIPFVSDNFLWHTGLAGACVSTPCFVISAMYMYKLAKKFTMSSICGLVSTALFLCNPNILYLQATPLTELLCIASLAVTTYWFFVWLETGTTTSLVVVALATFIATLVRYDGWALCLYIGAAMIVIGFYRRYQLSRTFALLIVYGTLAMFGMFLWFIWNQVIFGDSLYFQRGPYSAQQAQRSFIVQHTLPTDHNLFQAVRYFGTTTMDTLGITVLAICLVAVAFLLVRHIGLPRLLIVGAVLTPTMLYLISLYTAQIIIYIGALAPPHHDPSTYYFNVRYGVVTIAPACLLVAILCWGLLSLKPYWFGKMINLAIVVMIIGQAIWLAHSGVITIQDGQKGLACAPYHPSYAYLSTHYNGGHVLESMNGIYPDATEAGINFNQMIYQGSGTYWENALAAPQTTVAWVMMSPNDLTAKYINKIALVGFYTLIVNEKDGTQLYRRNDVPLVTHAPFPYSMWTNRSLCPS